MSDDDKKAEAAPAVAITEVVPSIGGGISALASANAPFLFFDSVTSHGTSEGVGWISIASRRQMIVGGEILNDYVVHAHMRATLPALLRLRQSIDWIEQSFKEQASGELKQTTAPSSNAIN